ncbi:MAG: MMPL family transporter [Solirubrobacteraceae bacterium]
MRYILPLAWIAGAVLATTLLPTIHEAQTGGLGDLVPNDAAAIEAEQRAAELFGFPLLSRTIVVQRDPDGLSPAEQARVGARALAITRGNVPSLDGIAAALPVTNAIGVSSFVRERSTTALTYLIFRPDVSRGDREIYAERLQASIERREDHAVGVTGALPARTAQAEAVEDALPLVELATVILVALLVGLHFRALLAPAVTLAAIAIAYLIAMRVIAALGLAVGVSVPAEVEPVVVVLLFGIVTDYAVFFLSRFRQRLADGQPARRAAESATAELQGIVLTAGLIVVAGSASLVVAKLGFFQAFGPGMAIAVVVAVAVALTFIPACLALFGTSLFWPSRPGRELSARAGRRGDAHGAQRSTAANARGRPGGEAPSPGRIADDGRSARVRLGPGRAGTGRDTDPGAAAGVRRSCRVRRRGQGFRTGNPLSHGAAGGGSQRGRATRCAHRASAPHRPAPGGGTGRGAGAAADRAEPRRGLRAQR